MAKEHNFKSIAFPCISTGYFGYPNDQAAKVAIKAVREYIKNNPNVLKEIIFVTYSDKDFEIYKKILN